MKYIDLHAHIFPENIAAKVVNQLEGYYKMKWQGNGLLSDLLQSIDKAKVNKTVIFSSATKPTQVTAINDYISLLCAEHKEFCGFGTMHPDFPDIEQEIGRFSSLGLRGLKLHPDFQQFYIDEPRMDRIYRAVGNKFPILLHVGDENSDYSAPERLAKVIDRMPDVVFIAAHFGGYSRWDAAKKYLLGKRNVYVDTSSCFHKISPAEGREMVRLHGADKVLFASDYPAKHAAQAIEDVLKMELTEEENNLIFYKNAEKLLGITC
jgi:predicted TIM-barrel fold metal-dependent hydrolase